MGSNHEIYKKRKQKGYGGARYEGRKQRGYGAKKRKRRKIKTADKIMTLLELGKAASKARKNRPKRRSMFLY